MIDRVSFFILSLVLSLTISLSQAQTSKIDSLRQKAEQGDADAQFSLGRAYAIGEDVSTDMSSDDLAGLGVPQDHTEAVKWYRKSAEQGFALAQNSLGVAYDLGDGVPQDYTEAVKWYRRAAEQGSAAGQINLGFMYSKGKGVPQDYVQAHKWYNLPASKLKGGMRENAANLRDGVAKEMTREQIAEAQRLAREWAEKHRK